MSSQQIPPFTPEALALLFARDNFLAFQQPGFPSHYWAPLLAVCCGASRNEVFFLYPEDLRSEQEQWFLCLRSIGSKEAPVRRVPIHPWLQRLGFIEFVEACRTARPGDRLFNEYKAGHENAGLPFSRAFVQWIKTTVAALPMEQQILFAEDFHFPSLRALFRLEVDQAGISPPTLTLLRGGHGDLPQAAAELATLPFESFFPCLPHFSTIPGKGAPNKTIAVTPS